MERIKIDSDIRDGNRFCPEMLSHLLRYVFKSDNPSYYWKRKVIVITDWILHQRKQQAIEKAIGYTLRVILSVGEKFCALQDSSSFHRGLQVAD